MTKLQTFHGTSVANLLENVNKESKFILTFFGSDFDYVTLYDQLRKSKIPFIGCMDTGRLYNDKYILDSNSAVLMSFSKEIIQRVSIFAVDMRTSNSYDIIRSTTKEQFLRALKKMNIDSVNPNIERTFGINLLYGLQSANPYLEGEIEGSLYFQTVGGSSGGKFDFKNAPVISSLGYGNLGVTAIIELQPKFYYKTDLTTSFRKIETTLKVTKIAAPRHILEFNGNKAIEEYARVLNLQPENLTPDVFSKYTLGLETGDGERLITSIQKPDGQGGLYTYNDVSEDLSFYLYEALSQEEPRKKKLESLKNEKLVGFISFDCVLCYLSRNALNEVEKIASLYEEVFPGVPKIGFGTFSENFCGANVNQTETFLAIFEKE
ncbi:MAG: hypothetical protein N3A69_08100 [Leptospiraceae bacterium]|nr:hypothetical protein [Leptospiraceae bacterium]